MLFAVLHDLLVFGHLVATQNEEVRSVRADSLVLLRRELDQLPAALVAALADEGDGTREGEVARALTDAFVRVAKDRLGVGPPLSPGHAQPRTPNWGKLGAVDQRATRKAQNEAVFREVNEQIAAVDERLGRHGPDQPMEIVCECGSSDCMERFVVRRAEYEAVRSEPTRFFVVSGHADTAVERVVAAEGGYEIVEKLPGEAAQIALDTDPRA